eukprot:4903829-Prymnesium_polylepis.1
MPRVRRGGALELSSVPRVSSLAGACARSFIQGVHRSPLSVDCAACATPRPQPMRSSLRLRAPPM